MRLAVECPTIAHYNNKCDYDVSIAKAMDLKSPLLEQ